MTHGFFNKLVAGLFVLVISATQAEAALKGPPDSQARTQYCKSKMDSCVKEANTDCSDTYPQSTTELALCKSSEVNVCKNTYGSGSDCLTRDLVSRRSHKTERFGGAEDVVSPVEDRSRLSKEKLPIEGLNKSPAEALNRQPAERPVSLKINQRLLLTNGNYVERLADGSVRFVGMGGRVLRTFAQGSVVRDQSGGVSIISGKQRVEAGVFKAIEATAARRDHRTDSAKGRRKVRDHR